MSESIEQETPEPQRAADANSVIRRRANRGSAQQMLEILSQAPPVEPEPNDRLPTTSNG